MEKLTEFIMGTIFYGCIGYILATAVLGDARAGTLDMMLASHHFVDKNYNERNYGLIYTSDSGFTVGGYKNSEYTTSYLAGFTATHKLSKSVTLGLGVGIVTGYHRGTLPYVLPSVTIKDTVTLYGAPIDGGVIGLSVRIGQW